MSAAVRVIAIAAAAALIGGAGFFALQPRAPTAATGPDAIASGGCYTAEVNRRHYDLSTWFLVANQRANRVDWDPKGMRCDHTAGTARLTIQITHRESQRDTAQIDTGPSIITQETGFTRERIDYVFDCKNRQIAALERRLMGDGEEALRVIDLTSGGQPQFKPYGEGGIGVALDGPVCGAGMALR
jgi:hypothetical protein